MAGMFDDLIPQGSAGAADAPLSFDDLIPQKPVRQPTSALPMFAQNAGDQFEDVAKSGGVGLAKGATGVLGIAGMAGELFDKGRANAAYYAAKGLEKIGAAKEGTADQLWKYVQDTNAELQSPGEREGLVNRINGIPFATPKGFDSIVQSAAGRYYEPKTKLGAYSQTIGEFLPGAAMGPGGMARVAPNMMGYGVLPGVVSEAAGQATEGTALEPWARGGAAMLTAGGAAAFSRPAVAERMAGRAVNNLSDQQFAQAQQLMRDAHARGVQLTVDEAVQHVTGGASSIGNLRRVVESTTEGGQRLAPVMAERPGQMRAAVDAELNRIAPSPARPYDMAPQVQDVGVQAMQSAERMRSNATRPYYEAARGESVNPNAVRSIVDEIDRRIAGDSTGIIGGPLRDTRNLLVEQAGRPVVPAARVPVTDASGRVIRYENTPAQAATPERLVSDIENLDRARKFIRGQNELPPFAAQAIPKEAGAAQGNIAAALRDRMERASDNFRQGRLEHERISRNVIEPLTNSPTGQLATAPTAAAQRGILFPSNPLPNSQQGIGNAMGSIANRDPMLARQVVRQEAEMQANNTVRGVDSAGRPDQFGGAKYARAMRDNPQFETNFNEALRRAGGDVGSHSNLVDVLQATGQRQRAGSMTAFNQESLGDLKRGGVEALVQALSKPLQTTRDAFARRRLGGEAERLADALLAGPDGLRRLQGIAREGNGGREMLIRALIAAETGAANARR